MAMLSWSAIVINWNGGHDLPACLTALMAQSWPASQIVVVDNASGDDSLMVLQGWPTVDRLVQARNLGFAGGANVGIRATTSELICTLNPDVTLQPDWAATICAAFAADERLGAGGGKLLYPDGVTIQHAGGRIEPTTLTSPHIGRGERDTGQYDRVTEVDFLTGGALMLRRSALEQVGGFDEGYYPAYYEDVDLCARLRAAGWSVRYLPLAVGQHRESTSVDRRGADYYRMIHGGRLRFAAKYLPLAELVQHFLPREAGRLTADLHHLSGTLVEEQAGLTSFPEALWRATSTGADPEQPRPIGVPTPSRRDWRSLLAPLAEVRQRWLIEERPFTSSAPLIGPLIVWLRTQVNNAGPRWHVRQLLAQQVEFNGAVTRALSETATTAQSAALSAEASSALLASRLAAVVAQQAELIARLRTLEQRLAALEAGRVRPAAGSGQASPQPAPDQHEDDQQQ